ncbi:hypothetical protein E6C60_2985 [Paenibacillus algicola]|uniref:Uncharacterized protein n=1 Tax=Paenibacillus algicola TaxID=2565926 RepID=A0A4P8XLQ9_9BACL|nr:hypothetical protein E6C60_2985 [Paenibacillus algicola]
MVHSLAARAFCTLIVSRKRYLAQVEKTKNQLYKLKIIPKTLS